MFKTGTHSAPPDKSGDTAHLQQPEIELISLYERLAKAQKGSEDYKQILEEIEGCKDRMDAHRQLFCALMDAVDRERLGEIEESVLVVEKRIHTHMNELLDKDLTFTEMMRLSRIINTQIEQIDGQLRNPRGYRERGGNRSNKFGINR